MDLERLPALLADSGEQLVIAVRHEPVGAALLRSLGVEWRIAADAPTCLAPCGFRECRSMSVVVPERARDSVAKLPERDSRCAECPWPDVCQVDRTCWNAEREAEQAQRAARRHGRSSHSTPPEPAPEPVRAIVEYSRRKVAAAGDYREQDADGRYGCKIAGCEGRSRNTRGATAYLCDDVHAPEQRERLRLSHAGGKASQAPPRSSWLKVPGTGLQYRSAEAAYAAAAEIEEDGERVAEGARFEGKEGKAEQAIDESRELAERVRAAARAAEERAGTAEPARELAELKRAPEAVSAGLLPPRIRSALAELLEAIAEELRTT